MNALFDAILTKYNAHSDLSGALTEMSLLRSSERRTYPYCVFYPVTERPLDTFTEDIETFLLQFNIYDDAENESPNNISTIKGYLWDCFDDCSLTVSGYHHIFMHRRNTFALDTGDSYQYSIEYEVMLERQSYIYADLDGDSQYFYRSDTDFPEAGITGDMTIQAWVKPNNLDSLMGAIASKMTSADKSYSFFVSYSDLQLWLYKNNAQYTITTTGDALDGYEDEWVHVSVTFNAGTREVIFYIAGVAVPDDGGAMPDAIDDTAVAFRVGVWWAGSFEDYFYGAIDRLALFDDVRSAAEILESSQDRYIDLSGEGNLIGLWKFDDAATATKIDNAQGDAGRDLIPYDGGDVTYGECGRTVD